MYTATRAIVATGTTRRPAHSAGKIQPPKKLKPKMTVKQSVTIFNVLKNYAFIAFKAYLEHYMCTVIFGSFDYRLRVRSLEQPQCSNQFPCLINICMLSWHYAFLAFNEVSRCYIPPDQKVVNVQPYDILINCRKHSF